MLSISPNQTLDTRVDILANELLWVGNLLLLRNLADNTGYDCEFINMNLS